MRRLGSVRGKGSQVASDGGHLPFERLVGFRRPIARKHAAHEAADHIRSEGEPDGFLALACTLEASTIEKRAKCQHVRPLLKLAEQLLSGKQREFLPPI